MRHKPVSLDPLKDKIEYQHFTIRLIPTIDGYYGFDILRGEKLVLHQTENPLPNIRLIEKADAYLAAKWLINEYQKSGHFPRVFPPGFERQFHSSSH
ncbi:hypothetical protein FC093_14370 [Ilyomonas limi]|uniref:Uncharacterized protein n=1 Tax=Ilyomonas limi TaxID=2575867 RepID=A0A4V5UU30_9BACT|nr:hypothetical protein [Ilyomonas limi]TKK67473.1 hypothetical protein FC093_14370 [Ilyomonas limi]